MSYPLYKDYEQVSQNDFSRARLSALLRRILNRLLGKGNDLLVLDAVVDSGTIKNQHALGLRIVPVEQIVGSTARTGDFDRSFNPRNDVNRERWKSVAKASHRGVSLPPVELTKVGEQYFVVDGHHRVSVARQRGQTYIDAHVVEMVIMRRI